LSGDEHSMNLSNLIHAEHVPTLSELNDEYVRLYLLPRIVFTSLLMAIGIPGNALVLYIYYAKFPKSNHRVFILCLAIIDMLSCCITFPFYISFSLIPYMFYNVTACKLFTATTYYLSITSGLLLGVIAIERYLKVCRPWGRQMSERGSRVSCSIVLGIGLGLAWPTGLLFGHSTVHLDTSGVRNVDGDWAWNVTVHVAINVTGVYCGPADEYSSTNIILFYEALILLVVVSVCVMLIVLYFFIARQIYKHRRSSPTRHGGQRAERSTLNTIGGGSSAGCKVRIVMVNVR
jgi:hypothetical protein